MGFKQKYGPWALIVGASEGLGAAFAENCAQRGLNVALVARRAAALEETAAKIESRFSVQTRNIVADAGKPEFHETLSQALSDLEIGMLIYNAAAEPGGRFLDIALADHLNNIQVNCIAPTILCHELGKKMVERGRGGIVLVSSLGALQGIKQWVSYGAAKAYELLLGEGLWDEMRDHGVDAFAYVVGSTFTPTFQRIQKKLGLPFADGVDPSKFPPGAPLPRPFEEVAATLFAHLEDGPRVYSHPDDEAKANADALLPRREVVEVMGRNSEIFFKGGLNSTRQ
jgi:short-subunit dehydrogenase